MMGSVVLELVLEVSMRRSNQTEEILMEEANEADRDGLFSG